MSTIEEKKTLLAKLLAEARDLIDEIGVADDSDPYAGIQPPSSSGSMSSATTKPGVTQAIDSIEVAKVEVGFFETGVAILDRLLAWLPTI